MSINTNIKICGLFREEDILVVNEVHPDYVGFVFYPPSHRNVSCERAKLLGSKLEAGIKRVGVFVDTPIEEIAKLLKEDVIQIAQLHGTETIEEVKRLKEATGSEVWKAIKVTDEKSLEQIDLYLGITDMMVLDSGMGSGASFDWNILSHVNAPYFLAGGLNPNNLEEALEKVSPYGIDISSGVETERKKDKQKIKEVMRIMRRRNKK